METFVRIRCLLLLMVPLAASCSTGAMTGQDKMCAEIAKFASMTVAGESHSVVLRGGWGGDEPNSLMTHDCRYSGYAPGDALCAYLVPNTSWEFGHYNARRAAACLDSSERQDFIRRLDRQELPAQITSSIQLLADKQIQVTVRLEADELSILTLSAARSAN